MIFDNNTTLEDLLSACRSHDDAAFSELVSRYTPLIRKLISEFSIEYLGEDELFSEGCVALYQAALSYDMSQSNVTFGLYSRVCISHRFVDIKRRESSLPEFSSYDVENVGGYDGPEKGLFDRERIDEVIFYAKEALSDYEYSVLLLHIQGYKTSAIAERLKKSPKSVDNAKARLFRRLRDRFDSI